MFLPNLGCYMGNTWILNRRCLTKIGNMINKHGIVRARQLSWKWWISTALTYHKPIPWHRATDQFRGGITVQEPISAEKYVYLGGGQNRKYVIFIRYNMYKTWDINNIYYKSGGQNTYYPQGTWPKVGGPLSVVNVFAQIWTSHVHFPLLSFYANCAGYSYIDRYIYIYVCEVGPALND